MKVITTGLLNRFWTKGIKPWLDKRIKSYADLMVTTASGYTPDALAVKEGFTELNSNLQLCANKRSYVNSVIGKDTIAYNADAYQLYILVSPYPNATTKIFVPFIVDLGMIKFTNTGISIFKVSPVIGEKYNISIEVNVTNNTVKISDVTWGGTDISSSARLIVSEVI